LTTKPAADAPRSQDFGPDSAGARLAERLARDVLDGQSVPGTVIASEQELRVSHDAGRAVFRQAVRILEERGVAYMRRGHGGGLVVAEPNPDFVARSLSIVAESLTRDVTELAALPAAVDSHLFLYTAPRLSPERCDEVRRLARRLDRTTEAQFQRMGGHRQLHRAIYTASGEPAVILAHRTTMEYGIDIIPYSVNVNAESARGEAWRITYDTAEAVIADDTPRMFDCRRRLFEMLQASWPNWSEIERDPRLAPKVGDISRPEFHGASSRAERLTREILREIRLMGWTAGERLGGGAELMARYGASTNILRQAVRMLEEHSAVEVVRGRKGGLFVATPNRQRAVAGALAFLRRSGAAPADVRALLMRLALEGLDRTAAFDPARLDGDRDPRRMVSFNQLCELIAASCGSPVVELFVEILLPFAPEPRPRGGARQVSLKAFASGDLVERRRLLLAAAAESR
jgi:DNA-binding FadR family transcriptional regulator